MIYQLKREQFLNSNIDDVWSFASSPHNLKKITPKSMGFIITSIPLPSKMYPGMIITYKVSPILSVKMTWVAEITQVEEKKYFVDEQRVGPYDMWHHEHFFEECQGGVMMRDVITYKLPFHLLGSVVHGLFVKRKLENIFDFRFKKMDEIFNQN